MTVKLYDLKWPLLFDPIWPLEDHFVHFNTPKVREGRDNKFEKKV